MKEWEAVIGLEIHVQLTKTKTKLFSHALNQFGEEPNTNISEVCTGQPGSLPVLNKEAVKKALLFGFAVDAKINPKSTFDRKSYFYPDSPRNFQITQFENPIIQGGYVEAEVEGKLCRFSIHQAHLEDDAGMLKHFHHFAGIDYNRAGVPLIEIVSNPCMHTKEEASGFAKAVKAIFQYIEASDCNMEEGSLRMDVNVSVRPKGSKELRTKTEVKNMNSFTFMEQAIEIEMKRQISLYEKHPEKPFDEVIEQATYRFDPNRKELILMRKKEKAADYRYFPEPDLPPLSLSEEFLSSVKKELPELPHQRLKRYTEELLLPKDTASYLVLEKSLSDYFEKALKHTKEAKSLANWIIVEFTGRLKERGETLLSLNIPPKHVAELVELISKKTISGKIAKSIADDMVLEPNKSPQEFIQNNPDYQVLNNSAEIEALVNQVLQENQQSIQDYIAGKNKAFAFLVGQVMKLTKGKASPEIVNSLLHKKLDAKR